MTRRFDDPWAGSRRRDEEIRKMPIHVDDGDGGYTFAAIIVLLCAFAAAAVICLT